MTSVVQELAKNPHTGKAAEDVLHMTNGRHNAPKVGEAGLQMSPTLQVAFSAKKDADPNKHGRAFVAK